MRKRFDNKNTHPYHFELGRFIVDFYIHDRKIEKCYAKISTDNNLFSLQFTGDTYLYLLESARQGNTENINGFCATMFAMVSNMYSDAKFAEDMLNAVSDLLDRKMAEGAEESENVTPEQEQADQALMEGVAEYADGKTDKERKEIIKQWHEDVKDVIENG